MGNWARLGTMLNRATTKMFGRQVVFIPSAAHPDVFGTNITLEGIFTDQQKPVQVMGQNGIEVVVPMTTLELLLSDLGFLPLDSDQVAVDGVTYQVRDVVPDGIGSALLTLDRTS